MRPVTFAVLALAVAASAACDVNTAVPVNPDAPSALTYVLEPSGDPNAPLGVLLSWTPPSSGYATSYDVYGRNTTNGQWLHRGTTTSPTFHDAGDPQLQYYVQARDYNGNPMGSSDPVTISATRPATPLGLTSISLNHAVQLVWQGNAVNADFDHYRVYSATYNTTQSACNQDWAVEGTTVSDAFLSANLQNGVRLCYAVSAISVDGHESVWSAFWDDTPRPDGRNVLVWNSTAKVDSAGFIFRDPSTQQFAVVTSGTRTDLAFNVSTSAGSLWLNPVGTNVTARAYSATAVTDLTAVDAAPATGYASTPLEAKPGYAYVFRIQALDGVHYGAVRVAFVTADYLVLDWSYQTAVGNPELSRQGVTATIR